jgi:twinkle protein
MTKKQKRMNGMYLSSTHLPCPDQINCRSSDAYAQYEDHGHCFSCGKRFSLTNIVAEKASPKNNHNYTYEYLPWRGVRKETMEFFKVKTAVDEEGVPNHIMFPYGNGAVKNRLLNEKKFWASGPMSDAGLFGHGMFQDGGARAISIFEGELDALSGFQMLGSKYPVAAVSSTSTAKRDCIRARDYLNSFDKIYLCLDNDEPGQKAVREIATLFDFNKVYHVKLTGLKDANDFLQAGRQEDFTKAWWGAKRFLPEGIISGFKAFDDIIDSDTKKPSVAYPFKTLEEMTYGLRTGETVLFTALEGIGKTEIIRAIEYHLLTTTDANIGAIHLEESKSRQIKGLAGYKLELPVHLPDSPTSKEEVKKAYRDVIQRDDRLHLYSHFGSDDPDNILDTVRFLASACNCKYIFLDHITMVVTGLHGDDERRALDYISTRLAMMAEELDFCLIMVSHVNDEGLTRGSRNISKVAHLWVHLYRNVVAPTTIERNLTYLTVNKNRFAGRTGPAGVLQFNPETFMLKEHDPNELPV